MADTPAVPSYLEMLYPTLQALDRLGGSGTKDEIDQEAVRIMGLTDEQLAVEFPPEATQKGSKVIHRLAWARTYLKKFEAVDNSRRGVWTLEAPGRKYLELNPTEGAKALRLADSEVRRQNRARRVEAGAAVGVDVSVQPTQDPEEEPVADETEVVALDWKARLLERLFDLSPDAFERLAQRLLRVAGFKNVEVLGRSNDGGIDGVGLYRPSLVSFPIFFQCKKWRGSVVPDKVRDFRGAMSGRGEKGLLIITSTFTAEAKREARRDGAPPVELIDGDDLCDLLKEYAVGVTTRMVEAVDLDEAFFSDL